MPLQRRQLASHRPSPFPLHNSRRDTQRPLQRFESIITNIYAEISKMQQQQHEAILMLRNYENMLRKQATEKAGLEEQNQWLFEQIKTTQEKVCNLEFKNRELEYQLAKERQERPDHPAEKQS